MPKGETVAIMADALHVSADYLLCRTNDPTDYCRQNPTSDFSNEMSGIYHEEESSSDKGSSEESSSLFLLVLSQNF